MRETILGVIGETWDEFWKNTNISGANNAGRSANPVRRFIWVAIFIAGIVGTVWGLLLLIQTYLKYPVITSMTLTHETKVSFPAITICNQNRVNCNNIRDFVTVCNSSNITNCSIDTNSTEYKHTLAIFEESCKLSLGSSDGQHNRKKREYNNLAAESQELKKELSSIADAEFNFLFVYMTILQEQRQEWVIASTIWSRAAPFRD